MCGPGGIVPLLGGEGGAAYCGARCEPRLLRQGAVERRFAEPDAMGPSDGLEFLRERFYRLVVYVVPDPRVCGS